MNCKKLDKNKKDSSLEITQTVINSVCGMIPYIGTGIAEIIKIVISMFSMKNCCYETSKEDIELANKM